MAFGAANFNVDDYIAIARAEQLAQRQKEVANAVAKACGLAAPEEKAKVTGSTRRDWGDENVDGAGRVEDQEESTDVGALLGGHGQFALEKRPRSNSPSAKPTDPEAARKKAQELGLRLCRRGRRAAPKPKAQAAPASGGGADLDLLFQKPDDAWEAQYAGEGGRAPLLPEEAQAVPKEWKEGVASTGHRLGAPPLRRRGQEPSTQRRAEGENDEREQDHAAGWSHNAFAVSTDMWFGIAQESASSSADPRFAGAGVAPFIRYKPIDKDLQQGLNASRSIASSSSSGKPAPTSRPAAPPARKPPSRGVGGILPLARGPATGAAGAGWDRDDDWDDWSGWSAQASNEPVNSREGADKASAGGAGAARAEAGQQGAGEAAAAAAAESARPSPQAEEAAAKAKAPSGAARIGPGSVVQGLFQETDWYLATVECDNGDGTFTLAWFDGDPSDRIKRGEELKLMRYCKESQRYVEHAEEPLPEEPVAEEAPALEVGDRVRVVGLKTRAEMNGLLGTLIEERADERWQVAMDSDMALKIFKAKNLERLCLDGPEEVD